MSCLKQPQHEGPSTVQNLLLGQSLTLSLVEHDEPGHGIDKDIDGHIYTQVEGLVDKLLDTKPYSATALQVAQKVAGGGQLPDVGSHEGFATWLTQLQANVNSTCGEDNTRAYFTWIDKATRALTLSPSSALVISRHVDCGEDDRPRWSDVLAIGEIAIDKPYRAGLTMLYRHARTVFSYQPARVFLRGFYISGGKMESWLFDRSGAYSSVPLDIAKAPIRFAQVLISYMLTDDTTLGCGDLIKEDGHGKYIEHASCEQAGEGRLYLDETAIFSRTNKTVVGDGLTCYRARLLGSGTWEYAVKIKWSAPRERSEARMLALVKEKRAWGVLHLVFHHIACSTKDWRNGLAIGIPRRLHGDTASTEDQGIIGWAVDHTVEAVEAAEWSDRAAETEKVLDCLITKPLGKTLHQFQSIPSLLYALRDAIKCHRSLYKDAGVLHRDICPSNIIIPDQSKNRDGENSPRGVLIDLDVAKLVTDPWKQGEGIGTPPFQAIGVLQAYLPDNPHTYRHDLESFFYTFLFLAICKRPVPKGENQLQLPESSVLRWWMEGRPVDQARRKTSDMQADRFHAIINEFTPELKHLGKLAERMRGILFPIKDGKPWTGTDMTREGTDALYESMINVFSVSECEWSSL